MDDGNADMHSLKSFISEQRDYRRIPIVRLAERT